MTQQLLPTCSRAVSLVEKPKKNDVPLDQRLGAVLASLIDLHHLLLCQG